MGEATDEIGRFVPNLLNETLVLTLNLKKGIKPFPTYIFLAKKKKKNQKFSGMVKFDFGVKILNDANVSFL